MLTDEERKFATDIVNDGEYTIAADQMACIALRLGAELAAAIAEVERLQLAVIREREKIWAEREQHEAALREVQK